MTNVRGILEYMQQHRGNAVALAKGCGALYCLSDGKTDQVVIQMGGIRVVIEAMRAWKWQWDVQQHGCCALASLCSAESQKKIAVEGGVEVVIEAMRNHNTNWVLQRACLKALGSIATNSIQRSSEITRNGGVETILTVMRRAFSELVVQGNKRSTLTQKYDLSIADTQANASELAHACPDSGPCLYCQTTLRQLSARNSTLDPRGKEMAAVAHMEAVLVQVHEQAVRALMHLACNSDTRKQIQQAGGVSIILKAMQTHPTEEGLQEHGCGALGSLVSASEHRAQVHTISLALQTHKTHAGIQEQGRDALVRLAGSSPNDAHVREALCASWFP